MQEKSYKRKKNKLLQEGYPKEIVVLLTLICNLNKKKIYLHWSNEEESIFSVDSKQKKKVVQLAERIIHNTKNGGKN